MAEQPRNTRQVVPVRLSGPERSQIASGAARLKLPLSSFVRQAALQASAIVERKVSVKPAVPKPERRPAVAMLEDPEPAHFVDGDPVPALPPYGGDQEAA